MTRTPYGITTLVTAPGQVYSNQLVKAIANMGLSYVIMQLLWTNVETSPGVYDWDMVNQNIKQYNDAGLGVYYVILTAPGFRKSATASDGTKQMIGVDVLSLVEQLLSRYYPGSPHGTIDIGVGLNEDFDTNTTDARYNMGYATDVLNTICPVIQAANYGWVVGGPAHLKVGIPQITQQQNNLWTGGGVSPSGPIQPGVKFLSNCHFYAGNEKDPSISYNPKVATFNQMWQTVKAADIANGQLNQDIWASEFGWEATNNGNPPSITYAQQSQNLSYCLEASRLSGGVVSHVAFYTIQNGDENSVTGQGSPLIYRPAYYALQNIVNLHPAWPSFPVAATTVPIRTGEVETTIRTGEAETTIRTGDVDASVRTGKADATIRTGDITATATGEGSSS